MQDGSFEASVWHMRVDNGRHEVDFVVEREDGRVVAMEAKLSSTVTDRDVRHLVWLREQIGDLVGRCGVDEGGAGLSPG